jgi:hypothetical protein
MSHAVLPCHAPVKPEAVIFSLYGRIALMLLVLGFGIVQLWRGRTAPGAALIIAVALLAYGYVRYGTVWIAFRALRAGKSKRAETLLDQVLCPDWLRSQDRAYYEFLRGILATEREDWGTARDHFLTALRHNLRTSNNRAMVECALAETLLSAGDPDAAREHLDMARSHDHKPEVELAIRKVEDMLSRAG